MAWPAGADTITYSDTEFATADWTSAELVDTGNNGGLTVTQQTTGGNPGAYLWGSHGWSGGLVWNAHLYEPTGGATIDPGLGAITSIDFSADVLSLGGRFLGSAPFDYNVAFTALLEQDGTFYRALGVNPLNADGWTSLSGTGLTAADFLEVSSVDGSPTAGSTPDFSASGGEIRFGIMTGNYYSGTRFISTSWGVDNWSVTVNTLTDTGGGNDPVPEPGTLALFGVALLGYGVYRRRRKSA